MANLTEGRHTGEFLISEAEGSLSREEVTVTLAGAGMASGTLLGKITASGKYVAYNNGAANGTEVCAGILYNTLPSATGDVKAVIIARQAEVMAAALTGSDAPGVVDLKAIGIYPR